MPESRILGVIFDMDGVLCDSEPFIYEAARRMFSERYGLDVAREDFEPFIGAGEDRYLGGVGEKHGVRLAMPDDKRRVYEIYLQVIRGALKPLPGVLEFTGQCRALGMKLAVATSADRVKLDGNLAEMGLPVSSFDATVNGEEIRLKKPDPEIFLAAGGKLGLAPRACIVVEDAPNGIRAARAAGMDALGITSGFSAERLTREGARWTAPNLEPAGLGPLFNEITGREFRDTAAG